MCVCFLKISMSHSQESEQSIPALALSVDHPTLPFKVPMSPGLNSQSTRTLKEVNGKSMGN